ncbi:MAG: hypothetical protein ACRD08_06705, partial [Acidimicrobiales bacterium]
MTRSTDPLKILFSSRPAYGDLYPQQEPSVLAWPARVPVRPVPWSEPTLQVPPRVERRTRPLVYLT